MNSNSFLLNQHQFSFSFFLFQSMGFLSQLIAINTFCFTVFLTNLFHPHLLTPAINIFSIHLIFLHLISFASFCNPYPSPPLSSRCFALLWKYPSYIFYSSSTSTEKGHRPTHLGWSSFTVGADSQQNPSAKEGVVEINLNPLPYIQSSTKTSLIDHLIASPSLPLFMP